MLFHIHRGNDMVAPVTDIDESNLYQTPTKNLEQSGEFGGYDAYHAVWWWRHQMETFSVLRAFYADIWSHPGHYLVDPYTWPWSPNGQDHIWPWKFNDTAACTVKSPHKGQWCGALMFSLPCAWINDWVNNREAGDLRRYRGHYGVNAMMISIQQLLIIKFTKYLGFIFFEVHHLHAMISPSHHKSI